MTDSLNPTPNNDGNIIKSEKGRAYIYRVATALLVVLTGLGIIADNDAVLYLGLLAAVLGLPLAAANTTTKG